MYPAAERTLGLGEGEAELDDSEEPRQPGDLVPPIPRLDLVWEPGAVRAVWEEELGGQLELGAAAGSIPSRPARRWRSRLSVPLSRREGSLRQKTTSPDSCARATA